MHRLAEADAEWGVLNEQFRKFAVQHPKSANAWVFYAMTLEQRAWQLRGPGMVSTTTPSGRAAFKQYMNKARDVLDAHKPASMDNPEWYVHRIGIATYLSEADAAVDALFKEGVTKEPLYYDIYFSALFHRVPQWGGGIEEMVAFMNESIRYAVPEEGVSLYARLAWFADGVGLYEVIESPNIHWATMAKSFEDVLHAYPDDWNAQQFLLMACSKPDMNEARRLVAYVKSPASPALLGKNVKVYESCKNLALGKGQPFMMRDPNTGAMKYIR